MTVELRAVETTCRGLTGNAYLLESQFLHDAPARLVSLEVPDADCLRAKVAEGVTNSCVCRLRSQALSGVFRRLEQALVVQEHYRQAFNHLRAEEFYEAWCELERTELALGNLERHETEAWAEFRLDFIQEHTVKWQSLFPYKMFFSPEFLSSEKLCSICQQPVVPHSFCGHRVGEIYDGEMCYRTVTKLEVLCCF